MEKELVSIQDVMDKKLTDWKKEPTLRELKQDYEDAREYHNGHVSKIETWLDNMYIRGRAKIKVKEGNSSIVPKLIRKQAEWRYAALSEPFLSSENIYDVGPVSWEDKTAADQNSLVLNNQFTNKIDKQRFIDDYVRAAVDEGTVIIKTGWEFREEKYKKQVPQIELTQDDSLVDYFTQIGELQSQSPSQYEELPEEIRVAFDAFVAEGIAYRPEIIGYVEQEATRTTRNQPTLEVCDFRNVIIDPSCAGDMLKAGFVIHRYESSMHELKADGRYENLEYINLENQSILGEPDYASASTNTKSFNFSDRARRKFLVYEYWGFRDLDGSGRVQPFVAAWVGNVLVRMTKNPFPDQQLPFVTVPYLPVRRDVYGESDGSLLEDNQKVVGAVTRGMIDIMAKTANGQTGIAKGALDTTNRRRYERGEDYDFNPGNDPRSAIHMHTFAEIPQSAQFMVQSQNMEAESLTGVKAFSNGISGQALGDTATGVRGALDAASKRELGILRRLSDGLIKVGRKIIAMNAEFLSDQEVVRVTNDQFVAVRRDDLKGEFDLKLTISTAEEDNNKASELSFMLQTIGPNAGWEVSAIILAEIAKLKKMPDLAKRILDYQPQPDPVAEQKAQMEIMLMQAKIKAEEARAYHYMSGAQLQGQKVTTEAAKATLMQSQSDQSNLDFLEQESGVKQERDLQRQGAQAEAQTRLKMVEHALDLDKLSKMPAKTPSK